jgi:hypothetical protein
MIEDCESISSNYGLESLYERLQSNQELTLLPMQPVSLKGPSLPDFEHEAVSLDEQEHLINAYLGCQRNLARVVCNSSRFHQLLQEREEILSQSSIIQLELKCSENLVCICKFILCLKIKNIDI